MMISADNSFSVSVEDTLHNTSHVISIWPSGQIHYDN
jgi:hypothetical protein